MRTWTCRAGGCGGVAAGRRQLGSGSWAMAAVTAGGGSSPMGSGDSWTGGSRMGCGAGLAVVVCAPDKDRRAASAAASVASCCCHLVAPERVLGREGTKQGLR
jgi:hypothetical protein